jgi:hypothetical protein
MNQAFQNQNEKVPSREAQFLLACLRSRHDVEQHALIQQLASGEMDWDYIARIMYAHGLLPFLHLRLSPLPPGYLPDSYLRYLKEHFLANDLRNRMLREEFRRLLGMFEQAGIRAIPLKGIVYASAIYENPAARQFGDLDFLVRSNDIDHAKQLFKQQGYRPVYEQMVLSGGAADLSAAQESIYRSVYHEYEFQSQDGLVHVDLHWCLLPRVYPIEFSDDLVWQNLVESTIGGVQTDTLSDELNLLYLCIHAAKDGWSELKWAVDISELVNARDEMDWEYIRKLAKQLRCEKMLRMGLMLAVWLTGISVPDGTIEHRASDRSMQRIMNRLQQRLFSRPERKFNRISCLGINKIYLQLCDTVFDKIVYVFRRFTYAQARDFNVLGLTESLLPVWPLLRPFRVIAHCARKTFKELTKFPHE